MDIQEAMENICMRITDNGKSFIVEDMLHSKSRKHLGLLGMRERVEMVGVQFTIESSPETGTTVIVMIPLAK